MTSKAGQVRDKIAKIDKYRMFGYSQYDAELLAEAELELEAEKAAG